MKPFILTPRAEQDVSDIWDYIADLGKFQPSLRDYSDLRLPPTTAVLGYHQPSLRDGRRSRWTTDPAKPRRPGR